jgi:hypothetical protein
MAVPRPVLLALLGVALCAAAFLATRGAQEPGGSVTAVPTPAPTPAPNTGKSAPKGNHATPKANHSAPQSHSPRAKQVPRSKPQPKDQVKPEPKPVTPTKPAQPAAATLAAVQAGGRAMTHPGSAPTAPTAPKPKPTLVARVTAALGRGDAVVFLFTRAGAADDTGTRQSVETLHGMKHVMVVKAGLKDLSDFRPVLAGAGVSQIPSIVIAHKGGRARLIEGYVDPGTLRQNVADALR